MTKGRGAFLNRGGEIRQCHSAKIMRRGNISQSKFGIIDAY